MACAVTQKWQVLKGVLTKVEELILGIIVHVTTNKSLPGKATNDPFSKLHVFSWHSDPSTSFRSLH